MIDTLNLNNQIKEMKIKVKYNYMMITMMKTIH